MKTHTHTYTHKTYSFDKLSPEAQENALEKCYDWNVDNDFWSDCAIDDAKEIGRIIGIDIDKIYFSGFFFQGDGACFEGTYEYEKGSLKAIKAHAPQDAELHAIVRALQDLQKRHFYRLSANVKHSGHYYHSLCTNITVENANSYEHYCGIGIEEELSQWLREFMDWIYERLESEFDYLTSEEVIKESLISNEIQFNEDGKMHY